MKIYHSLKLFTFTYTDDQKCKNSDFTASRLSVFLYIHKYANSWLLTQQHKTKSLNFHHKQISLTPIPLPHYPPKILTLTYILQFYTFHNNIIKKERSVLTAVQRKICRIGHFCPQLSTEYLAIYFYTMASCIWIHTPYSTSGSIGLYNNQFNWTYPTPRKSNSLRQIIFSCNNTLSTLTYTYDPITKSHYKICLVCPQKLLQIKNFRSQYETLVRTLHLGEPDWTWLTRLVSAEYSSPTKSSALYTKMQLLITCCHLSENFPALQSCEQSPVTACCKVCYLTEYPGQRWKRIVALYEPRWSSVVRARSHVSRGWAMV